MAHPPEAHAPGYAMPPRWGSRWRARSRLHNANDSFTTADSGAGDAAFWAVHDALGSVVAITDYLGVLKERIRYTPYGEVKASPRGDQDGDGDLDSSDRSVISNIILLGGGPVSMGSSSYRADADLNLDGVINSTDLSIYDTLALGSANIGDGLLSHSSVGNTIGWAGYVYDPAVGLWLARHRWYDPQLGRWICRDPIGYVTARICAAVLPSCSAPPQPRNGAPVPCPGRREALRTSRG